MDGFPKNRYGQDDCAEESAGIAGDGIGEVAEKDLREVGIEDQNAPEEGNPQAGHIRTAGLGSGFRSN